MLTSTLLEQGLADEVLLAVYPVLLGTGKRFPAKAGRMEPRHAHSSLPAVGRLVSTQAFPSGIIFNTYKVVGPLKTG